MSDQISYLKAKPEEFSEIYKFHLSYFGAIRSEYVWEWQYGKFNPNKSVLLVGKSGHKIIATQGAMAVELIIGGQRVLTGKNESLLLETEFRKKGALSNFYEFAFDEYLKAGFKCIWGFTKAVGPFEKIGFSFNKIMIRAILPLNSASAIKIGKFSSENFTKALALRLGTYLLSIYSNLRLNLKLFFIKSKTKVDIHNTLKEQDDLVNFFSQIREQYPDLIHINMNPDFYNWRVTNSPNKMTSYFAYDQNTLCGYLIAEKNKDYLDILDFNFMSDEIGQVLAKALLVQIKKDKEGFIIYSGNKLNELNKSVFKFLKNFGFIRIKGANGFVLRLLDLKDSNSLKDYRNWYVTSLWYEGN